MAFALILTLLGLGAVDAALCRGSDGHFGIDTRVSSCCGSPEAANVCSNDSPDQDETSIDLLSPAIGGDSSCEHTPLIQATPATYHYGLVAVCTGRPVGIQFSSIVRHPTPNTDSILGSDGILCRLRSITLLI